ncbi:MAG: right-handed parallel beta-helix repeat-containing protein [Verrucomicrobia bacterium]|nr:right-handed parallel beta-helix repeat-containing protein [Verrucomicrobiota bacterium]
MLYYPFPGDNSADDGWNRHRSNRHYYRQSLQCHRRSQHGARHAYHNQPCSGHLHLGDLPAQPWGQPPHHQWPATGSPAIINADNLPSGVIFNVTADYVTISNITLHNARTHGIAIQSGADSGRIEACTFANPSSPAPTSAIDGHGCANWTVTGNNISGITGTTATAEPAIHFHGGASGTEITNNLIYNCDRAIGLGSEPVAIDPAISSLITGTRYYLDANHGDDTATGTAGDPWKTLAKAQAVVQGGDAVILGNGNYGKFSDTNASRTAFCIYMAAPGALPEFTEINLNYGGRNGAAYLLFYRIYIHSLPVVQDLGVDPQDPKATGTTYKKTSNPISIESATHVWIAGCRIAGQSKYLTGGININRSQHIKINQCHIHDASVGVSFSNSQFLEFTGNHIHKIAASAFQSGYMTLTADVLIEANHAHDANWNINDDFCPRAPIGQIYHGSGVAIRGNRYIIRNNIFHDGFPTAGIAMYNDTNTAFSDIRIENNILYDIRAYCALRLDKLLENIYVRNNLIVGHAHGSGTSYYDGGVSLSSLAVGATGNVLNFDNNIVVGTTDFGAYWGQVSQRNNIFYCARSNTSILDQATVGGGSMVLTATSLTSLRFENEFFSNITNHSQFTWDSISQTGHHQLIDWSLSLSSPAIGFGDSSLQPPDGIGGIDADGFIFTGAPRSLVNHNAGPSS